jgi:hypothetical protein
MNRESLTKLCGLDYVPVGQREAGPSPQPAAQYGLNHHVVYVTPTARSAER